MLFHHSTYVNNRCLYMLRYYHRECLYGLLRFNALFSDKLLLVYNSFGTWYGLSVPFAHDKTISKQHTVENKIVCIFFPRTNFHTHFFQENFIHIFSKKKILYTFFPRKINSYVMSICIFIFERTHDALKLRLLEYHYEHKFIQVVLIVGFIEGFALPNP